MKQYMFFILGLHIASSAPLTLMIDCGTQESDHKSYKSRQQIFTESQKNSLCSIIHDALPKSVKEGKFFVIGEQDQTGSGSDQSPTAILPPKGFKQPKFRTPKIQVPKIRVPHLKPVGLFDPPKVTPLQTSRLPTFRNDEESSAERMEKVKNGMQKMLHVVKVLGQIDQYVSERTRAIIEILSRTFSDS